MMDGTHLMWLLYIPPALLIVGSLVGMFVEIPKREAKEKK